MSNIIVIFKDGVVKEFLHQGRAGGSYTKRVEYVGNFIKIIDEWYNETVYPSDLIKEVKVTPHDRYY